MGREGGGAPPVHLFFFPFMAPGHLIPMAEMAKLFAARGCRSTIVATESSEPLFATSIEGVKSSGFQIDIALVELPLGEVGLPEGCDGSQAVTSPDAHARFMKAVTMLDKQLGKLLEESRPDCLISDMFLPWTADVAARYGVPRVMFHGLGYFALCATEAVWRGGPHKKVSSDSEPFVIPDLPGEISLTRSQLPDFVRGETEFSEFIKIIRESGKRSFGVLVNTFHELEPVYAGHYKQVPRRKAWNIGPISLCNKKIEGEAFGVKRNASGDQNGCLKWLDSRQSNSVIYICFGSMANFSSAQLQEIAVGLEASGQQFLWVVKKDPNFEEGRAEWLPEGYEQRTMHKGLIIRGWAPQVSILEHKAIGAFVTHCGWNSILEAVCAGVPMVTWPVEAEQFYNEKLVTQVLGIGTPVGVKQWVKFFGDSVGRELVEKAVSRIMVGEEVEQMRNRSRSLAALAKKAVEEGGSSYSDLDKFLKELRSHKLTHGKQ